MVQCLNCAQFTPRSPPMLERVTRLSFLSRQDWMKRSADLTHFVTSQESRPECCGLSLPALLITPVQRIPR